MRNKEKKGRERGIFIANLLLENNHTPESPDLPKG